MCQLHIPPAHRSSIAVFINSVRSMQLIWPGHQTILKLPPSKTLHVQKWNPIWTDRLDFAPLKPVMKMDESAMPTCLPFPHCCYGRKFCYKNAGIQTKWCKVWCIKLWLRLRLAFLASLQLSATFTITASYRCHHFTPQCVLMPFVNKGDIVTWRDCSEQELMNAANISADTAGRSVNLNVDIDVTNEPQGWEERHRAKHQRESIASEHRVSKELSCLQSPGHVGTFDIVEHGIKQHKQTGRPAHTSNT